MKIGRGALDGYIRLIGAWDDAVIDLARAYALLLQEQGENERQAIGLAEARLPADVAAFLRGGGRSWDAATEALAFARAQGTDLRTPLGGRVIYPASGVRVLSPLHPQTLLCPGPTPADANLAAHAEFYLKSPASLVEPGVPIAISPHGGRRVVAQAELGIVFHDPGRNVPAERVMDHVFGYIAFLNLLAPDQFQPGWEGTMWHIRYSEGASFDRAGSLGPWIITADEVEDPHLLRAAIRVNEELIAEHTFEGLPRTIPSFLSYCSTFITLQPGLVVTSGSPLAPRLIRRADGEPAVEFPHRLLRPGTLRLMLDGIGVLEHELEESP